MLGGLSSSGGMERGWNGEVCCAGEASELIFMVSGIIRGLAGFRRGSDGLEVR